MSSMIRSSLVILTALWFGFSKASTSFFEGPEFVKVSVSVSRSDEPDLLFITNRAFREGEVKKDSLKTPRRVAFDLFECTPKKSVSYCLRVRKEEYLELPLSVFCHKLYEKRPQEVVFFCHGFYNLPEKAGFGDSSFFQESVFLSASKLQMGFWNKTDPGERTVVVIPIIWPCAQSEQVQDILEVYFRDRQSSKESRISLGTALLGLEKFDWGENRPGFHILAHSMGNRVLVNALRYWDKLLSQEGRRMPSLFKTIVMVAADVTNEELEEGKAGFYVPYAARSVGVYFAENDKALGVSALLNLIDFSKRLGATGPKDMSVLLENVYAIDCKKVNKKLDSPIAHTYFIPEKTRNPVFEHIYNLIVRGEIEVRDDRCHKIRSKL
jgi:hypothetical protein